MRQVRAPVPQANQQSGIRQAGVHRFALAQEAAFQWIAADPSTSLDGETLFNDVGQHCMKRAFRLVVPLLSPSRINGGMSDFTTGGIAVISIGFCGGPVTGAFGLLVGGAMLIVGITSNEVDRDLLRLSPPWGRRFS